jgi:tetratricopeptide (TPR) repeat protein
MGVISVIFALALSAGAAAPSKAPAPPRKAKPAVSEAARKAFVSANTIMAEAKTPADYADAARLYEEAAAAAPQWPDPHFNLAKARELAGQYDPAVAALKRYIALGGADARQAQDLVYALETKRDRAAKAADAAAAAVAARKLRITCYYRSSEDGVSQTWFEVTGAEAAYVDRNEYSEPYIRKMARYNVALKPVHEARLPYRPDPADPDHFIRDGEPRAHAKLIDGGARVKTWAEDGEHSESNPNSFCPRK